MKTFIHPQEIEIGSKVRVIGGHYTITKAGSEGTVTKIYKSQLSGEEDFSPYYVVDFYKKTGRRSQERLYAIDKKYLEAI